MKKFSFRLETVLKVKERKEEELKRQLMHITGLKIEQEKILQETKNKRAQKIKEKNLENEGSLNVARLIYFEQHLNMLLLKIDQTENKIKDLEKQADIKRKEVVEASRERKTFEKLKERDFKLFKQAVLYNEQKDLDEIAITKFNRKEQHSV
jgi:flagellar FliJ protein